MGRLHSTILHKLHMMRFFLKLVLQSIIFILLRLLGKNKELLYFHTTIITWQCEETFEIALGEFYIQINVKCSSSHFLRRRWS